MTKVTILGSEPTENQKKQIEFVKYLETDDKKITIYGCEDKPHQWENIILLSKKYRGGIYDLMLCYDGTNHCNENSYSSILVLGHFNDGIV